MIVRGLVFLSILVMVFLISRQNASQREKIKQMELDAEAAATAAAQAQPRMSDPIVTPLPPDEQPEPEPEPFSGLWGLVEDKNLGAADTFHLHPDSQPALGLTGDKHERTKKCLDRCAEDRECDAVVFDEEHARCWGKKNGLAETPYDSDQHHYFYKCQGGDTSCKEVDGYKDLVLSRNRFSGLWDLNEGKDLYPAGDVFHLERAPCPLVGDCTPEGNRVLEGGKSTRTRMCLDRCAKDRHCKAVVFDSQRMQCWGKNSNETSVARWDRHYFAKCRDGSSSPNCKAVDGVAAIGPAPAEDLWSLVENTDLRSGGTFYLHSESEPALKPGDSYMKERTKMCIDRCAEDIECEAVVFDEKRTKCWGKTSAIENALDWDQRHFLKKCNEADDDASCKSVDEHLYT